jgi:hypothetical protein
VRSLAVFSLLVASCGSVTDAPDYQSVRDRLTHGTTQLDVGPAAVAGRVFARRKTRDGWLDNQADVVLEHGALKLATSASSVLQVSELTLGAAPIELPTGLDLELTAATEN